MHYTVDFGAEIPPHHQRKKKTDTEGGKCVLSQFTTVSVHGVVS